MEFAQQLGFELDDWQEKVLQSTSRDIILNCSRQSGKSTISALLGLYHALYHPNSLVLIVSPSLRQSGELFKRVTGFYMDLGQPIKPDVWTALQLHLQNGSRILALPGSEQTLRCYSGVSLLIIDEASRVLDETYFSVRPMLAISGGTLILLSTPHGKRGFFYDTWQNGGDEWLKVKVLATDCPRITAEFLAEERQALGEWWYKQEYLASFEDNEAMVFRSDDVEATFREDVEIWF